MKKQTQHNICWSQVGILATVLIFSMLNVAKGGEQTRKFADPKNPYSKLVGAVTQLNGKGLLGNGFIIGAGGCHVVTNVHIAFGASKDSKGAITLVDDVSVGHQTQFHFDFDQKSGKFKRQMKATVVEFGNYDGSTRRGSTKDVAVLKLESCLGPDYGIIEFDNEAHTKRFPEGKLTTFSYGVLNGKEGIIEEQCDPMLSTPITGLMLSNCVSEEGMSGSMLLEKSKTDAKYRLVGIFQGRDSIVGADEKPQGVSVAVYARAFNPIIASALGENSPVAIGPVAGDRTPQNDQTAMLAPVKARTVVR